MYIEHKNEKLLIYDTCELHTYNLHIYIVQTRYCQLYDISVQK